MTKNYLEILPGLSVFFLLISKTIPFPNCNFYLDSLNIDAKFKKKTVKIYYEIAFCDIIKL